MGADDLARAHPLARVLAWLSSHPAVTAALGGPGRVGLYNEPPYPRLRVVDTNAGTDRDLRWLIAPEIQIEAYGDLDGTPGKAALNFILYTALGALKELPEQAAAPGEPVITHVMSSRGGGPVPEPTGQQRYVAAVLVYAHPGTPV
ncbi:hypothetical protein [Microbispora sp. NPDC049125]|uniref:hypothetical protein n=1 Tax=Microbispora sp. NPDC049125 TaxID=3154929 RepID=UPI003466C099